MLKMAVYVSTLAGTQGGTAYTRQTDLYCISICLVCLISAHGTGYSCRDLYPLHAYGRKMLREQASCKP
jgi:hypothetical protein